MPNSWTSGRTNNISKNLKQNMMKLRKSQALAKREYDLLVRVEQSTAEASRDERSTQTDSFFFVGNVSHGA